MVLIKGLTGDRLYKILFALFISAGLITGCGLSVLVYDYSTIMDTQTRTSFSIDSVYSTPLLSDENITLTIISYFDNPGSRDIEVDWIQFIFYIYDAGPEGLFNKRTLGTASASPSANSPVSSNGASYFENRNIFSTDLNYHERVLEFQDNSTQHVIRVAGSVRYHISGFPETDTSISVNEIISPFVSITPEGKVILWNG